jgi:caffeoyl-CoA O-methyltransferase
MNYFDTQLQDALWAYAETHSSPAPAYLARLERQTHLRTLQPRMLSGHLQGRLLSFLSALIQPKRVLEIGTFTGYSALCLAEGLPPDGILYALEANDERESLIREFIAEAGFEQKIELHIGNALEIVPKLTAQNPLFDLVFIDAAKRDYPEYLALVINHVRSGGLIVADNVLWSGKVLDEKKDNDTRIIDAFNKNAAADPRLETLLLPLRDGLTLMRVK